MINKNSGAGAGRKIKIITCDNSGFDSNGAASCARQAVADKVAAYTGQLAYPTANLPILQAAGIPLSGYVVTAADAAIQGMTSVNGTGGGAEYLGLPYAVKSAGAKKIGIVSLDYPGQSTTINGETKVATNLGMHVVKSVLVPITSTSMTAAVAEVRAAGADTVFANLSPSQDEAFLAAAQSVGYAPNFATILAALDQSNLKTLGGFGSKLYGSEAMPTLTPTTSSPIPAVNQFRSEMNAAVSAGQSNAATANWTEPAFATWAEVHGLATVMEGIKGTVTAASLSKALETAKNVNVVGLWQWTPSANKGGAYPHETDGGLTYVGPMANGYFVPGDRVPVIKNAGLS